MTRRLLVTGAGGLLGREVAAAAASAGLDAVALGHDRLDVTDEDAVAGAMRAASPDAVVHCAAMTDVDACELDPERCWAVNAKAAGYLARAAERVGAYLVAISTDYVFDGTKGAPYDEDDLPHPLQTYGRAKLAGEELVLGSGKHAVVRPAWIFGPGGRNFFSRVVGIVRSGKPVKGVVDQRGSPTYAPDLAGALLRLLDVRPTGVLHLTNAGSCTSLELVEAILSGAGVDAAVEHARLADLDRPAPRPADTSLQSRRWAELGLEPLRCWEAAAAEFAGAPA